MQSLLSQPTHVMNGGKFDFMTVDLSSFEQKDDEYNFAQKIFYMNGALSIKLESTYPSIVSA